MAMAGRALSLRDWLRLIGALLLALVIIAALVLSQAGFGHVWPAENSLNLKL